LLRLAGDDRLVAQIRRGNGAAFEVAFERHSPGILAFCRHMLGSPEEAEDAVQHTFAAAYRDLRGGGEREIALKPWLFTIARNRCLSILRARRELPQDQFELATAGLAEQVERRAELRELLGDIRELPDEQRAALLLAEAGGLAQADIASVLGCEVPRVKALVYRARSSLVARREARELPCERIREQLSELRGGSLRRTELRLHLRECSGCREFREQVRRQRQMMAVALPVAPTLGLKASVLAAVGIGGGGAAAGGAALAGGSLAGVAKVAAVTLIAAGGTAVVVQEREAGPRVDGSGKEAVAPVAPATSVPGSVGRGASPAPAVSEANPPHTVGGKGSGHGSRGHDRTMRPHHGREAAPGQLKADGPRQPAKPEHVPSKGTKARGRGPIEAPPKETPVRRRPPEPKVKEQSARSHEPQGQANGLGKHEPKLE
jgi:RNA polymerase sigma factor (sigma-70 family)